MFLKDKCIMYTAAVEFPSNEASVNDLFKYVAPLRFKIYFSIRVAANMKKQWSNRRNCHRLLCLFFLRIIFFFFLHKKYDEQNGKSSLQ